MPRVDPQLTSQPMQLRIPRVSQAIEQHRSRERDALGAKPVLASPIDTRGSTVAPLPELLGVGEIAARYRCSPEAAEAVMRTCGAFAPAQALLVRSDRVDDWEKSSIDDEPHNANRSHGEQEDAQLLTATEVAAFCSCSRKTIYRAVGRGDLKATRLGSQLRVSRESLMAWIATQARPRPRNHEQPPDAHLDPPAQSARQIRSLVVAETKT